MRGRGNTKDEPPERGMGMPQSHIPPGKGRKARTVKNMKEKRGKAKKNKEKQRKAKKQKDREGKAKEANEQ